MDDRGRAGLHLALKCIDRLAHHLEARALEVPASVRSFLDDAWGVLKGSKKKLPLAKIDRQLDRLVVDEQDAGFEQCLLNRLYYALSLTRSRT